MVLCERCGVVVDAHRIQAVLRTHMCPACGADQFLSDACVYCRCCGDCLVCQRWCYCDSGNCRCGAPRTAAYGG